MPSFKAPQYSKKINPNSNTLEACYTFNIDFNNTDDILSIIIDTEQDITLQLLQQTIIDNLEWWNTFIGKFIQSSSKCFAKPYTPEALNKIMKHTLSGSLESTEYPIAVLFTPKDIQIYKGVVLVNWYYNTEKISIDIPDFEENIDKAKDLPVNNMINEINQISNGVEELDIDTIPVKGESTEKDFELTDPSRYYEKQRVKESRLKAKLAIYKAERQMTQYYEKYGTEISDSDDDSESESEEDEY